MTNQQLYDTELARVREKRDAARRDRWARRLLNEAGWSADRAQLEQHAASDTVLIPEAEIALVVDLALQLQEFGDGQRRIDPSEYARSGGTDSGADPMGETAAAPHVERNHGHGALAGQVSKPQPKEPMPTYMSKQEYASLREFLRDLRKSEPDMTPKAALETVNKKLARKMTMAAFYHHWKQAETTKNGRGGKKIRITPREKPATTAVPTSQENGDVVVHNVRVHSNSSAESAPNGRSKIRLLVLEGEITSSDLERIAQTFAGMLRG